MISRACCRQRLVDKVRVGFASAQEASVTPRTACMVVQSTTRRSRSQHLELRTTATSVPAGRERAEGAGKGEGNGIAGLDASTPYVLPAPTWSLSDLNLNAATSDEEAADSAAAALSLEEVAKLCALAHIELAPEGGGSSSGGSSSDSDSGSSANLDVATVQKDVGAMLRCMQTMRREGGRENESEDGDGEEEQEQEDGPWGRAAPWAAPLQEDVVSDGDIQEKVLGAAQRSDDGFFTAPKVIEK